VAARRPGRARQGAVGLVSGVGDGVGSGVGSGVGAGVGSGVGSGVGWGVAAGVGLGVAFGVAWGVGRGVGRGVRRGVAAGVGVAVRGDAAPADADPETPGDGSIGTTGASVAKPAWLAPAPASDGTSLPPGLMDAADAPGVPVAESTPPCPRGSDWAAKAARTTTRTVNTPAIRRWSGSAPLFRAIGRAPATGRVATGTTGGIWWAWGGAFETTNLVGTVGLGAPGTPIR
jgi:hypothetical protein